jgi:hypothetical protein
LQISPTNVLWRFPKVRLSANGSSQTSRERQRMAASGREAEVCELPSPRSASLKPYKRFFPNLLKEGAGGISEEAHPAIPTAFCWRRGKGACGTVNLSSDDALDVLQISCRSRARPRQGFARGWAKAHHRGINPSFGLRAGAGIARAEFPLVNRCPPTDTRPPASPSGDHWLIS